MSELRIGDAERERALAALGEHFAQGRLAREEYDERADAVWTARTASDLAPLFGDLPDGSPVVSTGSTSTGREPARGVSTGSTSTGRGPAGGVSTGSASTGRGPARGVSTGSTSTGRGPASDRSGRTGDRLRRARAAYVGLSTPVQVLLAAVLLVLVMTNLPVILVAGAVWFFLSRHHGVGRPPWAQGRRGCGW